MNTGLLIHVNNANSGRDGSKFIFSNVLERYYSEGRKFKIKNLIHSKIPVRWRTAAPSLYGMYSSRKECSKSSAISGFRTRKRWALRVQIRERWAGFNGALTGVEFACSDIKSSKKHKGHTETTETLFFDLREDIRSTSHTTKSYR